jgi:hypothetical protein
MGIFDFLKQPKKADDKMNAFNWFLFLGLVAVIGFMWSRIIKTIVEN